MLRKRYEDERAIREKHIQCLFEMPQVHRESASAIRRLVDHVQKTFESVAFNRSPYGFLKRSADFHDQTKLGQFHETALEGARRSTCRYNN